MGIDTKGARMVEEPSSALPSNNNGGVSNGNGGSGGGGRGSGGGGGAGSGDGGPSGGSLDWNMARETSRNSFGEPVTVATMGYRGYTTTVHHYLFGEGHITGHKDGTLHRHHHMSDDPQRGDKIKSNSSFGRFFDVIGKLNPKG